MSILNKITWAQVGLVTAPGRYIFRFGWLTIAADDLSVWQRFPNAAFTLVRKATAAQQVDAEEFVLGAFELRADSNYSDSGQ